MLTTIAPSATTTTAPDEAARWWRESNVENAAKLMLARAKRISDDQIDFRDDMLLFGSLYSGRRLRSLYHYSPDHSRSEGWDAAGYRLTWNLVQACVDTAAARVTNKRTRVRTITYGGDWEQHTRAEGLQTFVDGLFYEQDYHDDTAPDCFNDGAIFGGGVSKTFGTDRGVGIERCMPWEILVDEGEGLHRKPRTAYHAKVIARDVAEDLWGDTEAHKAAIAATPKADTTEHAGFDVIEVVEGWHVGDDGKARRLLAVAGGPLGEEEYEARDLPLNIFRYGVAPSGWWGIPGVSRIVSTQLEIGRTLAKIQEAHRKLVGGHWANPIGSQVPTSMLVNLQGSVIPYAGDKAPTPLLVPGLPPEAYVFLETLWKRGFEQFGLSEMAATGTITPGLKSGAAQREAKETQDDRFGAILQRYEKFTVDNAKLAIGVARRIFSKNPELEVRAPGTGVLKAIKWRAVDMDEDSYVIQAWPASMLPRSPQAKIEAIQDMQDRGTISPQAAASMLGQVPDLESLADPNAAQYNEAADACSRMLESGEYEAPDEALDPSVAIPIAIASYFRAKRHGAPRARLGLLLQWRDDNMARARGPLKDAVAQLPPGGPGAGAMPPGAPPLPPGMPPAPPMPGAPPGAGMEMPGGMPA